MLTDARLLEERVLELLDDPLLLLRLNLETNRHRNKHPNIPR